MKTIHAKIANSGFACGKAFVIGKRSQAAKTQASDLDEELCRLDKAIDAVRSEYEQLIAEAAATGN